MAAPLPLTGLILAGGPSSRMGRPKALLPFGGELLIERQVRLLRPLCAELIIATNEPEVYAFLGLPMVADAEPGQGPLAGLEAGLAAATQPLLLGVACDMPFLTEPLVRALYAALAGARKRPLAALPRTASGLEPLCALWRREALDAIREGLGAGQRSPQRLLAQLPVTWLEGEELVALGDPARLFLNCNTPADYDHARQLAEEGAPDGEKLQP